MYKTDSSIDFTDHEDKKIIRDALERLGLDVNSNFVCLNVRTMLISKEHIQEEIGIITIIKLEYKKFIKASESLTKRDIKFLEWEK